jgi:hypothetical protein
LTSTAVLLSWTHNGGKNRRDEKPSGGGCAPPAAGGDRRLFGEIAIELGYIDDLAIRKYLSSKKGS